MKPRLRLVPSTAVRQTDIAIYPITSKRLGPTLVRVWHSCGHLGEYIYDTREAADRNASSLAALVCVACATRPRR